MIQGLEDALGIKARIEKLPEQAGDVCQTWASIDKAGRLLGYAPGTSYVEGVRQFATWLREQTVSPQSPVARAGHSRLTC
jgi:UDP-glucuronate 4-epimerase